MSLVTMESLRELVVSWVRGEGTRTTAKCVCGRDGPEYTCAYHNNFVQELWKAIEGDRRARPLSIPALESLRSQLGDILAKGIKGVEVYVKVHANELRTVLDHIQVQECVMGDWMQERDPEGYQKGYEDGYRKAVLSEQEKARSDWRQFEGTLGYYKKEVARLRREVEELRRPYERVTQQRPVEIDGDEIDLTNYEEVLARGRRRRLVVDPYTVTESGEPKDGGVGS